jgi:ketosteroid isomerase-like protein
LGAAALAAAEGRRERPWRFARRRAVESQPSVAAPPVVARRSVQKSTEVAAPTQATVVRDDAETRLDKTIAKAPPTDAASRASWAAAESGSRSRRWRSYVAFAGLLVAAAIAVAALEISSRGGSKVTGPLKDTEITAAVHQFASDYSHHDVQALARLLASDVTRVDPSSIQHGRAAVLKEYEGQFTTKPVPVSYALSHLTVVPGWAGRAQAQYTLTVSGGGTLSGHVVFGLQQDGSRAQVALISTQ